MDYYSESDQKEIFDEEYPSKQEADAEESSPSRSRSSKKKKKGKKFSVKPSYKVLVAVAVCINFLFIWNFMNGPISTFHYTLYVLGICSGINFFAAWMLFYKSSFKRFYLSLIAILGSFGYYFYVNYTNHSFLGNNLITSVLVIIAVLLAINPKVNYYLKSIVFLLIPFIGIYLSENRFALVWALMWSAGLVKLFRVSKSKSNKKEDPARKNQRQSA